MKKVQIAVLTVGVLFFMGCGNKPAEVDSKKEAGAKNENVEKAGEKKPETKKESATGSGVEVFKTITEAMASGKPVKCTYKMKNEEDGGEFVSTTYFNGKKFKSEMTLVGQMQYMIFDGETTYSWTAGQKQGMKMTDKCVDELNKNIPESPESEGDTAGDKNETFDPEENFDGALDVKCEGVSSIDFSLPKDVTFVDQCEMMKKAGGMGM